MSATDVSLALGVPVEADPEKSMRRGSVNRKLKELKLDQYVDELIDEQGYDTLDTLRAMSPEELTQVADDCKMKPGHKKKFISAFANIIEKSPITDVAPIKVVESAAPTPAVDPAMIAMEEMKKQMEEMKRQARPGGCRLQGRRQGRLQACRQACRQGRLQVCGGAAQEEEEAADR